MACVTLTKSRKLGCNSTLPGIQAISIGVYDASKKVVKTPTGVIELATKYGANSLARFEVKNSTIKYIENGISGGDNRSTGVKGTLPTMFNVADDELALTSYVEQMLKGPVVIFIERKDGSIVVAGSQLGAEAITADSDTGGTTGDFNGFTVTFTTEEADFSRGYRLTGAALVDYAAALMPV